MTTHRLEYEKKTLHTMISLYCRGHEHGTPLCGDCQALLDYATERLGACKFQNGKPFCSRCSIHCYKPEMRERIRAVMRYAGPRIIWRHPITALRHLFQQ